jgi:arsenate reductase
MPVRYRYEVEEIRSRLSVLAESVSDNVSRAMQAVVSGDVNEAKLVLREEQEINRREVQLEESCIKVINLHQPVADELRFLVGAMKINHDLERIGDLAAAIARRAGSLSPEAVTPFKDHLQGLFIELVERLRESMAAFFARDHVKATGLWLGDDAVDARAEALCNSIRSAILASPAEASPLFTLLSIVQRIERLADHSANIAKSAIYMALGEIVRHRMGEFRRKIGGQKPKVLMVCVHNSARSQMAAAWVNHLFGDRIEAESAGLRPGKLNPMAVRVMKEVGIDISGAKTRDVFEIARTGHPFSHLVTVCDQASAEKCPPFPGIEDVQQWDLPDPASASGDEEEQLNMFRKIRDELKKRVEEWIAKIDLSSARLS